MSKVCFLVGLALVFLSGPRGEMLREGAQNPEFVMGVFWVGFILLALSGLLGVAGEHFRRARRAEQIRFRRNRDRTFGTWLSS